jgi:hypothetical protein
LGSNPNTLILFYIHLPRPHIRVQKTKMAAPVSAEDIMHQSMAENSYPQASLSIKGRLLRKV